MAYLKKSVVMARVTERLGKGVWIGAKMLDVEEWELDHIMERVVGRRASAHFAFCISPSEVASYAPFYLVPQVPAVECNDPNVFKHAWWKKEQLANAMEKVWDAIHVGDATCVDGEACKRDFKLNKKGIWKSEPPGPDFDYADKDTEGEE